MEQINLDTLSDRLCAACGVDISHRHKRAKCCSDKCQQRLRLGIVVPRQRACGHCGASINHMSALAQFCSRQCNLQSKKKDSSQNTCQMCGVNIGHLQASAKHCSIRCSKAAWKITNPEKVKAESKRWRTRHPLHTKQWRKLNPEKHKASSHRRRARLLSAAGLQPVTGDCLKQRIGIFMGCCAYCGKTGKMEADHFLPLAAGGTHTASNIVPACKSCNCSKQASDPEQWFRAQPFFTEKRWQQILKAVGKTKQHHGQLALL